MSELDVDTFRERGFVRIDGAFSTELAARARDALWRASGLDPNDPGTWTQPVVRLGNRHDEPFQSLANTERLHRAFDALVGPGRWQPVRSVGSFVLRFPSEEPPGDDGWHIDVSFPPEDGDAGDFFAWRSNHRCRGRALLLLFLFTDVGDDDAPTRLREGSHLDMARRLAPAGEAGRSLRELAAEGWDDSAHRPVALATGGAGTVYACHPLLVHAAQPHRGQRPRFLAQPSVFPAADDRPDRG